MLVRAFRVTDRLGNAFLRIAAWTAMVLVEQVASIRRSLIALIVGTAQFFVHSVRRTRSTAYQAYEATNDQYQRTMAQRAAEAEMKPRVVEDPLRQQNRALSAFAVLLLLILLVVVVLQTQDDNKPEVASNVNFWPEANGTLQPTALFPTAIPTDTAVPDPLQPEGSLVYTMRDNGQDDLWAISVGQSTPLRLTNDAANDRDPAWSPDGMRVAFASTRDGNWELYIMEVSSGATTRMTFTPGFEGAPTWSPDGAWLAYEGYNDDTQDLDIYIISTDPNRAAEDGATRLTYAAGPDIEPAWSPQGRQIAYTSWRTGGQDIFIYNLDETDPRREELAINLTNSSDIDENYASWSPDGTQIAYSATVGGVDEVFIKSAQQPQQEATVLARGKMPAWSPSGASLVYTLDLYDGRQTQILTASSTPFSAATNAIALPARASDPAWTNASLPRGFIDGGGVPANPDVSSPLYTEEERQNENGLYGLAALDGVTAPYPYLSPRVNDSFEALRAAVLAQAGYDFLGTLEDAFWPADRPPEPGEPAQNWHYTGRAIAFNRELIYASSPQPIEIVREDIEVNTYWRVYVRVADEAQAGALGEPLRSRPWDFTARNSGNVEDYERGGRLDDRVPAGYYVDLTQIAEDYGWLRTPAQRTWQYNFSAIQYWDFLKTQGLSWNDAMLELYTPAELDAFLSEATSVPPPPPLPTASPTPEPQRSPTPIPPDLQS